MKTRKGRHSVARAYRSCDDSRPSFRQNGFHTRGTGAWSSIGPPQQPGGETPSRCRRELGKWVGFDELQLGPSASYGFGLGRLMSTGST
jgi:hypothetical protein